MSKYKYPRTPHLPDSPGVTDDDLIFKRVPWAFTAQVIVTEKMDGENTTIGPDYIHARSLDTGYHWSRTWVKNFAAEWQWNLEENERICGENMYAKHTYVYNDLQDFFLGFSYWEDEWCFSWDETVAKFKDCGISSVPVLFEGEYKEWLAGNNPLWFVKREGYVIRTRKGFTYDEFGAHVRKWVNSGFEVSNSHWMTGPQVKNKLAPSGFWAPGVPKLDIA